MATLIVFALSNADIPVVMPFFASIETVKAVCIRALFIADINGRDNLSTCFFVSAKQISPLPCLAIKFILFELAFEAGITKSPSFSLFLLSTKINILPLFASLIIALIDDKEIFFIFICLSLLNIY